MAIVLLEHTADTGDVLYGKLEHNQGHWGFADHVVLLKVAFHTQRQREWNASLGNAKICTKYLPRALGHFASKHTGLP